MKNCLFTDFADGLLRIIILAVPLGLGLYSQYRDNALSLPLTLTLAIISLFYSEYNTYKDKRYIGNRRIKIELSISLLFLAVSLFWTVYGWHTASSSTNGASQQASDYVVPIILYSVGTLPFFFETFFALIVNDLRIAPRKRKHKIKHLSFDVRQANIN